MRSSRTASLVVAVLGLVPGFSIGTAKADIIVPGSTYDVSVLDTSGDGQAFGSNLPVNSTGQFIYNGLQLNVTESEMNLGGGQYSITVDISGSADIFPKPGGNFAIGIGGVSDPLKLEAPFDLASAEFTFKNGAGNTIGQAEAISAVANPNPWDGFLPFAGAAVEFSGTGFDIQDINIQFQGMVAPLPSSAWGGLALFGGLGLITVLRRRWSAAA